MAAGMAAGMVVIADSDMVDLATVMASVMASAIVTDSDITMDISMSAYPGMVTGTDPGIGTVPTGTVIIIGAIITTATTIAITVDDAGGAA